MRCTGCVCVMCTLDVHAFAHPKFGENNKMVANPICWYNPWIIRRNPRCVRIREGVYERNVTDFVFCKPAGRDPGSIHRNPASRTLMRGRIRTWRQKSDFCSYLRNQWTENAIRPLQLRRKAWRVHWFLSHPISSRIRWIMAIFHLVDFWNCPEMTSKTYHRGPRCWIGRCPQRNPSRCWALWLELAKTRIKKNKNYIFLEK